MSISSPDELTELSLLSMPLWNIGPLLSLFPNSLFCLITASFELEETDLLI